MKSKMMYTYWQDLSRVIDNTENMYGSSFHSHRQMNGEACFAVSEIPSKLSDSKLKHLK